MAARVCIVGAGIAGLGAAWALSRHPDRFEIDVFERSHRVGGNAVTVDVPGGGDGRTVSIDTSVTAFVPSVYHNVVALLDELGVAQVPTRFSYSVDYAGERYAHDHESALKARLQPEIDRFQRNLRAVQRWGVLHRRPSIALSMLNPYNYVSMRRLLDAWGLSAEFRFKILKPLFINFALATNVFDMAASIFSRYLEFFDIEHATPMTTWENGTRAVYRGLTARFADRIRLGCGAARVVRDRDGVTIVDDRGDTHRYDEVILACNANQALLLLDRPTASERRILGAVRYETDVHHHAVVHTDGSVLPDDATRAMETRSTFVRQFGPRPDNYEVTYIMHNQQPWARACGRPCLVTYNPSRPIAEDAILERLRFQHVIHDVFHTVVLMNRFPSIQGRRHTWHCGAHTLLNSQEHCLISGLAAARQLGADYPFAHDAEARRWFDFYGRLLHRRRFRGA